MKCINCNQDVEINPHGPTTWRHGTSSGYTIACDSSLTGAPKNYFYAEPVENDDLNE